MVLTKIGAYRKSTGSRVTLTTEVLDLERHEAELLIQMHLGTDWKYECMGWERVPDTAHG